MILEKYRAQVCAIDKETQVRVCAMLKIKKLAGRHSLLRSLKQQHDQADLVLCLLRINTGRSLRYAEGLIGKTITHCPPALVWRAFPVNPVERFGDDRRVTSVLENPVVRGRRSWLTRYHLFKPGLSVRQLLMRGATRRDLKLVLQRKWITLESA